MYLLSQNKHGKNISVQLPFKKFEFTYDLSQENNGKNVSIRRLVKNRSYLPPRPGQSQ